MNLFRRICKEQNISKSATSGDLDEMRNFMVNYEASVVGMYIDNALDSLAEENPYKKSEADFAKDKLSLFFKKPSALEELKSISKAAYPDVRCNKNVLTFEQVTTTYYASLY